MRASGGETRRTNSVNPLPGPRAPIATILGEARASLAARDRPLIVRVPTLVAGLDAELSDLGFAAGEGATITLLADLADPDRVSPDLAQIGAPDDEWIAARARLTGWNAAAMRVYATMLGLIAGPAAFAAVRRDGRIVALAYGAIAQGVLVIESVATDAAYRRRGYGRQVVAALLDWGRGQGIEAACLQVAADNAAALPLYEGLGFGHELYRYHYRCERAPG